MSLRKRKRPTLNSESAEMLVVPTTYGTHALLDARSSKSNAQEHVTEISTAWSIVSLMSLRKRPTLNSESAEMPVVLRTYGTHVLLDARSSKSNAQEHVTEISTAWSIVSLMSLRKRKKSMLNRVCVKEPVVSTKKTIGKQDCTHSAVSIHAREINLDATPNAETMRRFGPIPGGAE